jgi:WD40 repeat protein
MSRAGVFYEFDERINTICSRSNMNLGNLTVLSKDLNTIFLETNKNTLLALDTNSQKTVWEIPLPYKLTALSISHDDALLAFGGANGKVILLDSANGNEVNRVTGNYGAVQQLAFSYNGYLLATAGFDGTVRIFGIKDN